jgi:hypothetical protein
MRIQRHAGLGHRFHSGVHGGSDGLRHGRQLFHF